MRTRAVTWVRPVLATGTVNLRRLLADRVTILYLLLLPALVTVLVGASSANADEQRVAVASEGQSDLVRSLEASEGLIVVRAPDAQAVRDLVRQREVVAGIVDERGRTAFMIDETRPYPTSLRLAVEQALADAGTADAAALRPRFEDVAGGSAQDFGHASRGNLALFVFITTVTGASGIVTTRRLGITSRMQAAPLSGTQVVAGEFSGRFLIAMLQALLVLVGTSMVFHTVWGSPLGVSLAVGAFALFCAAASVVLGVLARTEQQAIAVGILLGLSAAMLGGCLWSLDLLGGGTLAWIGDLSPHGRAMGALEGASDGQLPIQAAGALIGVAVVLVAVGARGLARARM